MILLADQPEQAPGAEGPSRCMSSPPSSSLPTGAIAATTPNSPKTMATTLSAPEIGDAKQTYANTLTQSSSLDVAMLQAARAGSDASLSNILTPPESGGTASPTDIDRQIIEALRSKDRLWVLKLGEMMENLIIERKQ